MIVFPIKYVFYISISIFGQTIIFSQHGVAATPLFLPQTIPLSNFQSLPQPIKAPVDHTKITDNPHQVLARVDDEAITVSDVEKLANALPDMLKTLPKDMLYPQLIKQLIVDHAIMISIKKDDIKKQPIVQKTIEAATKNFIKQQWIQAYLLEKLKPLLTPQAIQRYYNEHYLHQPIVQEIHLRQIIVQTPEIAEIVLQKLKEGQSFPELARIYSIDLKNRQRKQGDIGWLNRDEMPLSIAKAILKLKNNDYTLSPLSTDYGWVILQKIDARPRPVPTLGSVQQTIKERITTQAVNNLYEESLKNVHTIEY